MRKKKESRMITISLIVILLSGLSLLLYPTIANYWNRQHTTKAVAAYSEQVSNLNDDEYFEIWNAAVEYNRMLISRSNGYLLEEDLQTQYFKLLNVGGTGVMGYIEIPEIDVTLPIYHTTDEAILQVAAGHLEWTSLPVGGESSHCVISGHRGLPSAKLFTNLDRMTVGDIFLLRVLDEVLTYEVDQILIVEPQNTEDLTIVSGKDYCTLVTCTPYGINTHRLLVRGHRIETEAEAAAIRITAEAVQIEPLLIASAIGIPLLILFLIVVFSTGKQNSVSKRNRRKRIEYEKIQNHKFSAGPDSGSGDAAKPGDGS